MKESTVVEYATEEDLTRERLDEEDYEIPGVGWVRLRSLSREEVIRVRKATDTEQLDGPRVLVLERKMVAAAVIKPAITEATVRRWQKASKAGEMTDLTDKIQQMSAMLEGSAKAAYKSDGSEPGAGVRALPSGEAVDDGGAAAADG